MSKKIFYGWWVVLATSLIHCWGAGTFFYSFTAFFNPLVEEFGWSYASTSFAASLRSVESGIASPVVGWASDRVGARRLLLAGSVLSGAGFLLFSQIQTLAAFYILFIFLSIASSLLFPIPGWAAVSNWFSKKRGTAIGILSAAVGAGGGLIYFVNFLINTYGWRTSLVIIGIGMWVIGIPCSFIVRHHPEPYGLLPDGERFVEPDAGSQPNNRVFVIGAAEGYSLKEALRTGTFWCIALAVTVSSATMHAVTVHIMPYLISVDLSRGKASLLASLLIFVSTVGRFGFGWLGNRIDNRYLLSFGTLLQAAGVLFLLGAKEIGWAILFIVTFGPAFGGVITLRVTIQSQYFGRRAFGAIQGAFMAILMVGTVTSPLLTGWCFDLYGNYRPAWIFLGLINLAVIPIIMKLKEPVHAIE
ncbi:MAG: MFS transporter [Desulfobacteraceae bacterium]|nr:MAG: MFS transporter [Desulfobacteraceae bacterium]